MRASVQLDNSGFTIIETLVSIILLELVSTMGIMPFNPLWGNKGIMLKKEAFVYASQGIISESK